MTTTEPVTAAAVMGRSERSPITHLHDALAPLMFTADVVLGSCEFEYVFQGDRQDPDAVAVGRVRRFDTNDYRATLADGRVVAEHTTRRNALRAIVAAVNPGALA